MADVENQHDSTFPVKRKSDIHCQELDNVSNKAQKLDPSSDSDVSGDTLAESVVSPVKTDGGSVSEKEENSVSGGDFEAEEEQEGEEEEEDLSEDEIVNDRKGKGISREDKGKGKLIEEEEEDDDSEDIDDDEDVDDESDFSDDPLAEVDLDNILSSRTRRRSSQPGLFISNNNNNNNA
ncbi:unnamed protein product [Cochlearia groenlandica]